MRRPSFDHRKRLVAAAGLVASLGCSQNDGRENNTFEGMSESSAESGESESSPACLVGSQDCPCTPGGFCDGDLVCEDDVCVPPAGDGDGDPTTGDGDGDPPTSGDGDGDPTGGDGDGDPTTGNAVCDQSHFIEIAAVDADDIYGWSPTMSQLGEGMILAWDDVPDAYVQFDLAIPCDDFWHVWVRGVDNGTDDSFFATVDGIPDPPPVFELDCTAQPNNSTYVWRELNYRDPDAGPCETLEDPWVQDWKAGFHALRLDYRESIGLSKIYLSNTEMPP